MDQEIVNQILDKYKAKADQIIKDNHKKYFDQYLIEFDEYRGKKIKERFDEMKKEYLKEDSPSYIKNKELARSEHDLYNLIMGDVYTDLEDYFKEINKTAYKGFENYKEKLIQNMMESWQDEIDLEIKTAHKE